MGKPWWVSNYKSLNRGALLVEVARLKNSRSIVTDLDLRLNFIEGELLLRRLASEGIRGKFEGKKT